MSVKTTVHKQYRFACDVPQCPAASHFVALDEDRAAEAAMEARWSFIGLDRDSSWMPIRSASQGAYLHLCHRHGDLADTVRLVVALMDHKDELIEARSADTPVP